MKLKNIFTLLFLATFLFSCFFSSSPIAAKTIHVGEKGYEFESIQAAVENADSGDTIFVHCGVYYGSINLYKKINLIGEKGCTILSTNENDDIISISADGCNVSGFVVLNCSNSDFSGFNIESDNNIIENNIIKDNVGWGLYIYHSSGNIIRNNTFENDSISIIGQKSDWTSSTIENNTVNGLPILFYKNKQKIVISNHIAGQIILANCSFCEIINNTVSGSDQGIVLGHSNNNTVEKNHVSNTLMGIRLPYTDYSIVKQNNVSNNDYGLYITHSINNQILGNCIFSNRMYGCYLCCNAKYNVFSRNNFTQNNNSAYDYFENEWSLEGIGNYWSDYSGTDENNDGIGDTPYDIPPDFGTKKDNYPIVNYDLIKKEDNGISGFSIAALIFSFIFILIIKGRRLFS